ncbi:hypothetical protein DY000_02028728 [Brassica cretica]|uniref:Uncharacterized protein n=1 Tax=Brassica cretica TaxID=69181 RepID=A0ABQ7DGN2_BRACR|nr:hypothetical protein DY000_02028728 [Brassica cretica]
MAPVTMPEAVKGGGVDETRVPHRGLEMQFMGLSRRVMEAQIGLMIWAGSVGWA